MRPSKLEPKREPTKVVSVRLPSTVAQWVETQGGSHFVRAFLYMLWHKEHFSSNLKSLDSFYSKDDL